MNQAPPLVGRALLRCLVAAPEREYVSGDLQEELAWKRAELGPAGARRWYVGQAARSVVPLVLVRLRRGELLAELAAAQLLVLGALLALDAFWGLVLWHVPLRAATIAPAFEVASAVACAAWAGAVGSVLAGTATDRRRVSPFALCGLVLGAALVLGPIVGARPFVAPFLLTAGLCLGAFAGAWFAAGRRPHPVTGRNR